VKSSLTHHHIRTLKNWSFFEFCFDLFIVPQVFCFLSRCWVLINGITMKLALFLTILVQIFLKRCCGIFVNQSILYKKTYDNMNLVCRSVEANLSTCCLEMKSFEICSNRIQNIWLLW
jgi:hypothetical protein